MNIIKTKTKTKITRTRTITDVYDVRELKAKLVNIGKEMRLVEAEEDEFLVENIEKVYRIDELNEEKNKIKELLK